MGKDTTSHEHPVTDPLDGHTDCCGLSPEMMMPEGSEEGVARPWRAAQALTTLRAQVNAAWPNRKKGNDGTIGDAAHQSRASDHNPWIVEGGTGIVSAIDITHDPAHGCDANAIVAALLASRDPRIKYIIWNRRIVSSAAIGSVAAWAWRSYTGANPHDHHFHLSVKPDKARYDSTAPWRIASGEEGVEIAGDDQSGILNALSAIGASVDHDRDALPQLVAAQAALTQLMANHSRGWSKAEDGGGEEAPAPGFDTLKPRYEALFASAQVLPDKKGVVGWHVGMLRKGRPQYEAVSARTGVPWWFVGIVHAMEASFSFTGHLHNGDPLGARTVQVPKGRPKVWNPPNDWASSALDALEYDGLTNLKDWSLARCLHRFERFNGFGYYDKGINSPYLWSFSNHYTKGKFVADGKYDPNAVSRQCGAAVMLRALIDAGEVKLP